MRAHVNRLFCHCRAPTITEECVNGTVVGTSAVIIGKGKGQEAARPVAR